MRSTIHSMSRKGWSVCVSNVKDEVCFEIGNNPKYKEKREALEFSVRQRLWPFLHHSGAHHPYFQDLADKNCGTIFHALADHRSIPKYGQ